MPVRVEPPTKTIEEFEISMDPSRSRGKRILELAIQKNDDMQNNEPSFRSKFEKNVPLSTKTTSDLNIMNNLPTTSNCTNSLPTENYDNDDGDFSPASDDDRTYIPSKKYRRSSTSSSSSSSCSSSSSSSSTTSSSSSTSTLACQAPQNTIESTNNVKLTSEDVEMMNAGENSNFDERLPETGENTTGTLLNDEFWQQILENETQTRAIPSAALNKQNAEKEDSDIGENIVGNNSDTLINEDFWEQGFENDFTGAIISAALNNQIAQNDAENVFTNNSNTQLNRTNDTSPTPNPVSNDQNARAQNYDNEVTIEAQPVAEVVNKPKKKKKKKPRTASIAKNLRNSGQEYVSSSKTKKIFPARILKQTCRDICRLKCSDNVTGESREKLFDAYWGMASLERQREYIARNIENINPKYQYKKNDSNRKPKNAFYFEINESKVRVCKSFFKNTLDITDRCIRTVLDKKDCITGVLEGEKRGKHKKHRKLSDYLIEGVKNHINSIPRIESHYLRQQTTKEFIDGGKTLADLYSDYKDVCIKNGLPFVMVHAYRKIFNEEFNISFFVPKKDQCEQCTIYKLSESPRKEALKADYDRHLEEKEKSREEKASDKENISDHFIVACYDLQAVMTVPKGEVSTFYYKSKINCLNFTISELKTDKTECYFWDESQGNRGANEIGSCVLKFLQKKSSSADEDLDVVFYSDNCCGQQKNQFIIGMYIYAVSNLKIKSITHKFLIRGHTQNEGDAVHSTIEKEVKKCLKTAPIYVPSQYISAIRSAKKRGTPYKVNEMGYGDFINIKILPVPRLNRSVGGQNVKLSDLKIIKVEKNAESVIRIFYKTSYFDDFKELDLARRNNTRNSRPQDLKPLYQQKIAISERKKNDVRSLVDAGLIPRYYSSYYESIFN